MVKTSIACNSKLCFLTLALLEPSHRFIDLEKAYDNVRRDKVWLARINKPFRVVAMDYADFFDIAAEADKFIKNTAKFRYLKYLGLESFLSVEIHYK